MTYEVSHDSKFNFVTDDDFLKSPSVSIILMDFLGYTAPWSLSSRLDSTTEPRLQAGQHYGALAPGQTAPWSLGSRLDSTMEPRLCAM